MPPESTTNPNPAIGKESELFRIDGALPNLIEHLDELGNIYVQSRSRGGGLGKFTHLRTVIIDPECSEAIEPDAGLCISISELVMAHATRSGSQEGSFPSLDLEFASHSAGISFVEMPSCC